jgi:hypothetical protein
MSVTAFITFHWTPLVRNSVYYSLKSDLYNALTSCNTADSSNVTAHAQDATAVLSSVFINCNTLGTGHTLTFTYTTSAIVIALWTCRYSILAAMKRNPSSEIRDGGFQCWCVPVLSGHVSGNCTGSWCSVVICSTLYFFVWDSKGREGVHFEV